MAIHNIEKIQWLIHQSTKIYYTVKRGDTLSEIAMKYRTSIRKIKKMEWFTFK